MDLKLENVSAEDIGEVNRIQKLAFESSYRQYKFCPAFEATDEQMISFLEKANAYKILFNGMIVSSIFIYKITDNHYELDTISIDPQFQNIGIGGKVIGLIENLYPSVQNGLYRLPKLTTEIAIYMKSLVINKLDWNLLMVT